MIGACAKHEWWTIASCLHCDLEAARVEIDRLKTALGEIGALGERCEDCDPSEAPFATKVTRHPLTGIPMFLCDECGANTAEGFRKAHSKGCGPQPEVEDQNRRATRQSRPSAPHVAALQRAERAEAEVTRLEELFTRAARENAQLHARVLILEQTGQALVDTHGADDRHILIGRPEWKAFRDAVEQRTESPLPEPIK